MEFCDSRVLNIAVFLIIMTIRWASYSNKFGLQKRFLQKKQFAVFYASIGHSMFKYFWLFKKYCGILNVMIIRSINRFIWFKLIIDISILKKLFNLFVKNHRKLINEIVLKTMAVFVFFAFWKIRRR
jgi:hypothetical protein